MRNVVVLGDQIPVCRVLGNYTSAVQFLRWRRSPRRLVCSLLGRFHRPPGRSIPSETEVRSAVFTVPVKADTLLSRGRQTTYK